MQPTRGQSPGARCHQHAKTLSPAQLRGSGHPVPRARMGPLLPAHAQARGTDRDSTLQRSVLAEGRHVKCSARHLVAKRDRNDAAEAFVMPRADRATGRR